MWVIKKFNIFSIFLSFFLSFYLFIYLFIYFILYQTKQQKAAVN